jgi:hypothetical protein
MQVSFNAHERPEPTVEETPLDLLIQAEIESGIDLEGKDRDILELLKIPPDAIKTLVRWIIGGGASSRSSWRTATVRLATIAHAIQLDGVGHKSFAELGLELGCTRALISLYSIRLMDSLGITQFRASKARSTRETYRQLALDSHQKKGNQMSVNPKRKLAFSNVNKTQASTYPARGTPTD